MFFREIFFFSSRRRHTRLQGDWSSDVCSSDLITVVITIAIYTLYSFFHVTTPLNGYVLVLVREIFSADWRATLLTQIKNYQGYRDMNIIILSQIYFILHHSSFICSFLKPYLQG